MVSFFSQPEQVLALEARLQDMVQGKLIKPKRGVIVRSEGGGGDKNMDADDISDRMRRKVQGRGGQGGSSSQRGGGKGGKSGGGKKKRR